MYHSMHLLRYEKADMIEAYVHDLNPCYRRLQQIDPAAYYPQLSQVHKHCCDYKISA